MSYNSKYTGAQVEGLLDQVASGSAEVYVADFTMESLKNGMNNSKQIDCDMQALITALNSNKVILVREGDDSSYKGAHVLNGYAEDLLYFSIVDSGGSILWCEGTDYISSSYIDGRNLHLRDWERKQNKLISGENIKTFNGESLLGEGDITTPTFLRIGDADNEAIANFIAVANREKSADYYICSSKVLGTPIHGIVTKLNEDGPTNSPVYVRYTIYGSTTNGELAGKLLKITTMLKTATGATTTITEAILDAKQDAITDLATIREGASKGATSAQLYITPFDVLSLYDLAHNPHEVGGIQSNNQAITDALTANKIVLVPYAIGDESIKGYAPLVGYVEDLLYFKVITDSYEIYVETSRDADDILGQQVTYRDWYSKQDALKSGENIKTINGESILGSGDIKINAGSGGGSSSGTEGKEFIEKEPSFDPVGYIAVFSQKDPLERNKVYVISQPIVALQVYSINESGGIGDEYTIMFTATESTIITIPNYQVYWANGTIPSIASGDMCELSLVRIGNVMKATLGIFKSV